MVIRDFRVGNTILSDYAFGLNTQQFELLNGVIENSKLIFSINQYPRNLIKVKIEAEDVVDSSGVESVTLTEFPFDLTFTNILEGAEGIIIIDNTTSATKLKFEPTITIHSDSNISIRDNSKTVLSFVYESGIFYFQSDYKPISINLNHTIELDVDNSSAPIPGKRFETLKECLKYILTDARVSIYDGMFASDQAFETVIVNIYFGNGEYPEAFYVPKLESIGVKFRGISEAGAKPIFNATGVVNQFNRTVNVYESRSITIENLHFKRNDLGSTLFLATRNSQVTVENCRFENGMNLAADGTSTGNKKNLFQASNSIIGIYGELEIISAGQQEKTLLWAENGGEIRLRDVIGDPNAPNGINRSTRLKIKVENPITWDTIFQASRYSRIFVTDYLDGNEDGTPRYTPGSILYQQLHNITTGAEVENRSVNFPG